MKYLNMEYTAFLYLFSYYFLQLRFIIGAPWISADTVLCSFIASFLHCRLRSFARANPYNATPRDSSTIGGKVDNAEGKR